jgi:hypothetical protein
MSISQRIVDHGYTKRVNEIAEMNHLFTKVGFPENGEVGEASRKGSEHESISAMSELIQVAAVHEFGAPKRNIPERSFVRSTFDEVFTALQEFKRMQASLVIQGKQTATQGIAKVGEWLTNKTKLKINSNIPPANSLYTEARKKSTRTLIDTAQMLNSVQHEEIYVK